MSDWEREVALLTMSLEDLRGRVTSSIGALEHTRDKIDNILSYLSESRKHIRFLKFEAPVTVLSEYRFIQKTMAEGRTEADELEDAYSRIYKHIEELKKEVQQAENNLKKAQKVLSSYGKVLNLYDRRRTSSED